MFLIFLFSKDDISSLADKIVLLIQKGDFKNISNYATKEGIIFSIDIYIDSLDPKLSAKKLKFILKDTTKLFFGYESGSGREIYMTFNDFYKKYLNKDYIKGKKSINSLIGKTSVKNNILEYFKNAQFVEYYLEGKEEYDWHSLILVFRGRALLAIIHSSWSP
ncbi:MAG: hypothetical protein N2504_07240 [candidate division WOR-3 bacterium]|nr:hypothetical protein [candidate division WOR-3 bacterium]MCX7948362.1 hypothetical protein [candidate division WOR-3 bacterium]MDW8151263.1 hypothetical protein [candidate division WOR-3 bacterium]